MAHRPRSTRFAKVDNGGSLLRSPRRFARELDDMLDELAPPLRRLDGRDARHVALRKDSVTSKLTNFGSRK
jgi:hypothetical protein